MSMEFVSQTTCSMSLQLGQRDYDDIIRCIRLVNERTGRGDGYGESLAEVCRQWKGEEQEPEEANDV